MKQKFLQYCRKSTDTEDKQQLSIENQKREMEEYALKHGYEIVDIYIEKRSAKDPNNRPVFDQMLKRFNEEKGLGLISWRVNRIARNMLEIGKVEDMTKKGIISKIVTKEGEFEDATSFMMLGIQAVMGSYESGKLSEDVITGMTTIAKEGRYPGNVPIGYLNNKIEKTIEIDPQTAPTVQYVFEMYSSGEYSVEEIVKKLNDLNMKTQHGNKIYKSGIYRILKRSFYSGYYEFRGERYKGNHKPLISVSTFNRVQKLLSDATVNKKRPWRHKEGRYRGKCTCGECGCSLTLDIKEKFCVSENRKKKHEYYRDTNSRTDYECSSKPKFNKAGLDKLMQKIMDDLTINPTVAEVSLQIFKEDMKKEGKIQSVQYSRIVKEIENIKKKELSLVDKFVENKIKDEIYGKKSKLYSDQLIELDEKLGDTSKPIPDSTFELLEEFKNTAVQIGNLFKDGNDKVKTELVKSVVSNCKVTPSKIASISYNQPWDLIAKHAKTNDIGIWSWI